MQYTYPKGITYQELIASPTAKQLGIENIPANPYISANLQTLAFTLKTIRDTSGKPMRITSGLRVDALNKAVGGVSGSAHGLGMAADFTIIGQTVRETIEMIHDKLPFLAFHKVIDEFGRWVHLTVADANGETARQFLEAVKVNGKTIYRPLVIGGE